MIPVSVILYDVFGIHINAALICVLYFTAATVQGPVFNEFRKTALFLFFVAL